MSPKGLTDPCGKIILVDLTSRLEPEKRSPAEILSSPLNHPFPLKPLIRLGK